MTITSCICIVLCVFIVALFTFFTVVYLSELARERRIRELMAKDNDKFHTMLNNGKLPIVLMDLPSQNAATPSQPQTYTADKGKKNIN